MSTNDTVLLLANGQAGARVDSLFAPGAEALRAALLGVCRELARMMARDGEGASKLISIRVTGARSFLEARRVAKAVADYTLLKVAIHGEQFNWGRVVAAMGASLSGFDPDACTVDIGPCRVWSLGEAVAVPPEDAAAALAGSEVVLDISLGQGAAEAEAWACDIGEEYIAENVAYEGPAMGEGA
jgi:glutamate N-acetyltransferase/amino-acid N-acetyltransferase